MCTMQLVQQVIFMCQVEWYVSAYFVVRCGVRQGGVLSPFLFNIYVGDLIAELEASDIGCHGGN